MHISYSLKTKTIFLLSLLRERTDEDHPLSTKAILDALEEEGIHCDRKTLYSDMQALIDAGYDIVCDPRKVVGGWKLMSCEFEVAELKLLVDAVQSSRFITPGKSRELVEKLEKMTNRYEAGKLNRQVYVASRVKTGNENILYSIDAIHRAIQEDRQVMFSYMEWSLDKTLVLRGEPNRLVSPWALIWKEENYYLMAYDEEARKMKHFRVDKMNRVAVTEKKRVGREAYETIHLSEYVEETFSMYSGQREHMVMDFPNKLIGVVIDRFGLEVSIQKLKEDRFRVRTDVGVSPQFYGWLAGLGGGVEIITPKRVREEYVQWLQGCLDRYEKP